MTPPREPRTAAGRRLFSSAWMLAPGQPLMEDMICAIEAEAAGAPLREALDVQQIERVLFDELPNSDEWNDRIFAILARLATLTERSAT